MPLYDEITQRLLLSLLLGFIMGYQRTKHHKPGGVRTHALVALGSCLMTLVGGYGFTENEVVHDPLRVAAQIVSGVGFIGAGIIYRQGANYIVGLTTAAAIWVAAGLGIACGAGLYYPAFLTTFLVMVLFQSHRWLEKYGWIDGTEPEPDYNEPKRPEE
ncbi:MgtC/SapB family protein [Heliobacterium chlorum]|uniref:MgtC/SapB family protein n=1 Tax=Heliobacterium chlorum TaxID=2698 RepID=A0ABR7T2S1_HELCL|nr:MgtC/SapB family protein [Heliobacterium chlorum]MBC9785074.1 MgtC/SapB family protein [Heliobacterium chlorum]